MDYLLTIHTFNGKSVSDTHKGSLGELLAVIDLLDATVKAYTASLSRDTGSVLFQFNRSGSGGAYDKRVVYSPPHSDPEAFGS